MRHSLYICGTLVALAVGCGDQPVVTYPPPVPGDNSNNAPQRCTAPAGVSNAPKTIAEMVQLVDALPQPVTVPCFIEALPRPLPIVASISTFSAQPAAEGSPRVFAILDTFVVSWVPSGMGSEVLEFSEERPAGMSIKAELKMPIEGPVRYEHFAHINQPEAEGTVCRGCHQDEIEADDIGLGGPFFMSEALRVATREAVSVRDLQELHSTCDRTDNPQRCDIYDAMFNHGDLVDGEFPRSLPTIYD